MIEFWGASDDLIEVEGDVREEFDVGSTERLTLLVVAPTGQQAYVRLQYEPHGVWSVAYWPVNEDVMGFAGVIGRAANGYSARLVLDTPVGTRVERVGGK